MADFDGRIRDRSAVIGVVGLGYVGLPLAISFAENGFHVTGVDLVEQRIDALTNGRTYIQDVDASRIAAVVKGGLLCPTTSYSDLSTADVIFVCVPTPSNRAKAPDLSYIEDAARRIAEILRSDQLIVLESTTYPGTTEEILVPVLETSGLRAGRDFFVAFSPERIDPGNRIHTIANTAKVVGGIDGESARRAVSVLEQVVRGAPVHSVSTPRAAELTKLLENTFRAVNIALVNELAMLCDRMEIDIWEVIEAAKTKPYGFMPFYPGPGVGGHCIPVDPYYLSWKAREYDFSTKFIEIAAETNLAMPFFAVDKLRRLLRQRGKDLRQSKLLVLGASFKRDVDDARNSPAVRVIEILRDEGADIVFHDPYVPTVKVRRKLHGAHNGSDELRSAELTDELVGSVDCVVILVGHSSIDYERIVGHARLVFDTVNATAVTKPLGDNVVRL